MADGEGVTPTVRRYPDPFQPMAPGITEPLNCPTGNTTDADPHPQIAVDESTPGSPLPLRPARAAANDARYGGRSESSTPTIPDPIG